MEIDNIPIALTGEALLEGIRSSKNKRTALVDGFIYENTALMVSAPPGIGKSTLSTQVAIECAAGIPVFGSFHVSRPLKILYCQNERPKIEFLERAEIVSKTYPIVASNLFITDAYKVFNLLKEEHVLAFIKCVMRDCPNADIIFLDPIYPMVSGGLSKDEPASAFCKAMSLLQHITKATLYLNHHTTKPSHDIDGRVVEKDDPYYGSAWIKAMVTGSYSAKQTKDGVSLYKKKDNYKCLHESIHLEYDPSTELSHLPTVEIPILDRIKSFLSIKKKEGAEFSFNEMMDSVKCSTRALRRALSNEEIECLIEIKEVRKNKNIYKAKEVVS